MYKNIIIGAIAGILVIGSGSFYAGTKFAGKSQVDQQALGQGGQFRNGQNSGLGMRTEQTAGIIVGEILSKDDTSITVKLPDGGSKIIFFSVSTSITKSAVGSITDLVATENVIVNGSANSDGSINAQSIQFGPGMQGFRQNQVAPSRSN